MNSEEFTNRVMDLTEKNIAWDLIKDSTELQAAGYIEAVRQLREIADELYSQGREEEALHLTKLVIDQTEDIQHSIDRLVEYLKDGIAGR